MASSEWFFLVAAFVFGVAALAEAGNIMERIPDPLGNAYRRVAMSVGFTLLALGFLFA